MSCYLIKVENGHKVARSITSEEEYKQLRGSNEQKANLRLARAGNDAAKRRLVQFNYSGHYPQGVVKGMKLPSGAFGFDMDEPGAFAKAAKLLLKEPDRYGLLMLERSARQGGHAVFEREKGKTVLENQVRIATMLKCEMDTSAHDINRVYFTTTSDDEDLLFLSPRLFKDEYDEAAVAAEGKVLEERERYGQEELPEGAHKANKHYEPWKEEFKKDSQGVLKGQEFKNSRISTSAASASTASTSSTSTTSAAQDNYLGIPYGEIIKKWWQMYNDGQEPMRSNRNTLTFELAVNLRHICGFDGNLMAQIIPCYDGFSEQEKMACIKSALGEKLTQMPKRLKDVLAALRQEKLKQATLKGIMLKENEELINALDEANAQDELFYFKALPKLPQGVRDSVHAVGPTLALPVITAICPVIGTPDNTFTPLTDNLFVLTPRQQSNILQIAHLLSMMAGEVELPKLEAKGREWLEQIRLETMKDDDKVKARQRFRICPTTMRMMACIMLCKVAESLIQKLGAEEAETRLKENPLLWKEMIVKMQTPSMLSAFDVLANYQLENALYFFRSRIEAAFSSKDYCGQAPADRIRRGRNDTIFERLDVTFNFEQAQQQSVAIKGANVTHEAVRQMLKNWKRQGLINILPDSRYQKVASTV